MRIVDSGWGVGAGVFVGKVGEDPLCFVRCVVVKGWRGVERGVNIDVRG